MVTQKGANTHVIGIKGNFDDAQTGVKNIFGDKELEKVMNNAGFQFSSANSINIGRLVPQIVYYVYAYARLLANGEIKAGEKINAVVPTGNFGNILLHFMLRIWDFLLISLYVLLMRIRCYTISLQRVSMTETEISFLQHHHLWIFLSQATLKDLSIE